jgi:carbamate kinase
MNAEGPSQDVNSTPRGAAQRRTPQAWGAPAGTLLRSRTPRARRDAIRATDAARTSPAAQTVVVAIGGNASYPPTIKGLAEEQLALMATASEHLVKIVQSGYRLVLTHGNGPVVGNILFRMAKTADELPPMPMDVCVAHSQGGMGYMLQQTLANVLHQHGMSAAVSSIITRVEVSASDPGFANPTKPVGRFFAKEEAERLAREHGWRFVEDAGRGYRRVVPSPTPLAILDLPTIKALLAAGTIPIAAGGGGIPVVRDARGDYAGVSAVIDKDLTSALLAADLEAQTLVMLTAVERVSLHFGRPTQRPIDCMSAAEAKRHLADGQFPPGSMGPKITAALSYLARGGKKVVITSLDRTCDALRGEAGTTILP